MMVGRILLVGFGNMGQALARGWLERGVGVEAIGVVDPAPRALDIARGLGIRSSPELEPALTPPPDVVVLVVKPAQLATALAPLAGGLDGARPLIVSIAAGKPLAAITAVLGSAVPVVRAMPNTPAAIGRGMTVMTASATASAGERRLAQELLGAVGDVAWVEDERLMDAVTAVSGSGPAYVFLLIESLTRAGVAVGLDARLAERLATATVAGAGAYAEASGEAAAELRRRVTSPGGTTEAALGVLSAADGLPALLERAVRAAAERSRELSAQ